MREEEMELERMVQEVDNWWDDYMECVDDSGDTIMIDMTMETFFTNLYVFLWTDLAYSFMDCEDVNGDVIMMWTRDQDLQSCYDQVSRESQQV